jgi:hypothetical protein
MTWRSFRELASLRDLIKVWIKEPRIEKAVKSH